jgi:hypothetical protein
MIEAEAESPHRHLHAYVHRPLEQWGHANSNNGQERSSVTVLTLLSLQRNGVARAPGGCVNDKFFCIGVVQASLQGCDV